jgi:hypothetical protein
VKRGRERRGRERERKKKICLTAWVQNVVFVHFQREERREGGGEGGKKEEGGEKERERGRGKRKREGGRGNLKKWAPFFYTASLHCIHKIQCLAAAVQTVNQRILPRAHSSDLKRGKSK